MKRIPFGAAALLASVFLFLSACGNQAASSQAADSADAAAVTAWDAAQEAYHDVMSSTFHPAEEGDLAPLRARYAELATRADAWAALPLPAKHEGKGLEAVLGRLKTESAAIGEVAQNGSDEELTQAITALHDVFHEIVGLCEE